MDTHLGPRRLRHVLGSVALVAALAACSGEIGIGFDNDVANANVSQLRAERMLEVAETIADAVEDDPASILPCLLDDPDNACIRDYLREFGLHAWRRPLTDEELDVPVSVYDSLRADARSRRSAPRWARWSWPRSSSTAPSSATRRDWPKTGSSRRSGPLTGIWS